MKKELILKVVVPTGTILVIAGSVVFCNLMNTAYGDAASLGLAAWGGGTLIFGYLLGKLNKKSEDER